jgi:hypothetical protein
MNGSVAQALALTVAGNAFLKGWDIGPFWPDSEAFVFCEQVRFVAAEGSVAADPDEWLRQLRPDAARLRLRVLPRNETGISDRDGIGFANGGPRWLIEASQPRGAPAWWEPQWGLARHPNAPSPDRRIWSVTYRRVPETFIFPDDRPLSMLLAELGQVLDALATFVERAAPAEAMPGWADNFRNARRVVDEDDGLHRRGDPGPEGFLLAGACHLLHACGAASVFGGMGAWNDGAYWGSIEAEGDRLSEILFGLLNEGIAAAANSSAA